LAAKRIPRAIGLDKLLAISIRIRNGDRIRGAPVGIRELAKSPLKVISPNRIIPIHTTKANPNVNIIWVVGGRVNIKNPNIFKFIRNKNEIIKG